LAQAERIDAIALIAPPAIHRASLRQMFHDKQGNRLPLVQMGYDPAHERR